MKSPAVCPIVALTVLLLAHNHQARLGLLRSGAFALGLLWLASCVEEQRYQVVGAMVQMTPDLAPAFTTADGAQIYRIDAPFPLAITPPGKGQLDKLTAEAQGKMLPFPRLPWVSLHDLALQLDYAVTNNSAKAVLTTVTVNGINEFVYYAPGAEDLHQWQRRIALVPGQRVTGTVTELELDEIAIDLATVVNGAPNSNLVVEFQSQSGRDPRIQPYIPKVIPGLAGVRAGLEVIGGDNEMAPAPALTLELSLLVKDHNDRACKRGETPWMLPAAAPFTPIVPVADN